MREVDEVTGNQIDSSRFNEPPGEPEPNGNVSESEKPGRLVEFKQQVISRPVQENKFPAIRSQEQLDVIRRILRSECNAPTVEKLMPQINKVLND